MSFQLGVTTIGNLTHLLEEGNKPLEPLQVVTDLQWLYQACQDRLMTDYVKWSVEILEYLPGKWMQDYDELDDDGKNTSVMCGHVTLATRRIQMGRSLIACRDFARAAYILDPARSQDQFANDIHVFLYFWSRYLGCTRSRLEHDADCIDRKRQQKVEDDEGLAELLRDIRISSSAQSCPFLLWLRGRLEMSIGRKDAARLSFMEALKKDNRLWPAWDDLTKVLGTTQTEKGETMVSHLEEVLRKTRRGSKHHQWMVEWFSSIALAKFNFDTDSILAAKQLMNRGMDRVPMIVCHVAACYNRIQEHDNSIELFKKVRVSDPFRLEQMNLYSDSLFIRGHRVDLADLAHFFYKSHKFFWETCCIVGNHYSSRREPDMAIKFFQRALRLNPNVASIWVLIGHEFLEMKNNSAACLSYRRAIEVDERDHRAWYGLGQLYDIVKMHCYSIYYYQQAHKCKPQDSRMLVALGEVYSKMGRVMDAQMCFTSAYKFGDIDGTALWLLGKLFESEQKRDQAAKTYETYLTQYEAAKAGDESTLYMVQYLARYYLQKGNFDRAAHFAQSCMETNGAIEEGRHILKQVEEERRKMGETRKPDSTPSRNAQSSIIVSPGDSDAMQISDGEDGSF